MRRKRRRGASGVWTAAELVCAALLLCWVTYWLLAPYPSASGEQFPSSGQIEEVSRIRIGLVTAFLTFALTLLLAVHLLLRWKSRRPGPLPHSPPRYLQSVDRASFDGVFTIDHEGRLLHEPPGGRP